MVSIRQWVTASEVNVVLVSVVFDPYVSCFAIQTEAEISFEQ